MVRESCGWVGKGMDGLDYVDGFNRIRVGSRGNEYVGVDGFEVRVGVEGLWKKLIV